MKAWVVLLAFICAMSGSGIIWVIFIAKESWPPEPLVVPIFAQMGALPFIPVVILSRNQLMRRSRVTQWILAGVAGAVMIASFTLFAFSM